MRTFALMDESGALLLTLLVFFVNLFVVVLIVSGIRATAREAKKARELLEKQNEAMEEQRKLLSMQNDLLIKLAVAADS